jgi:hypothetical protein
MRRRDFVKVLGGAAAVWPLAARAQQSAIPVIGFLSGASSETMHDYVAVFKQGLAEVGFTEDRNVAFEYRWAEGHNDRLPYVEIKKSKSFSLEAEPMEAEINAPEDSRKRQGGHKDICVLFHCV